MKVTETSFSAGRTSETAKRFNFIRIDIGFKAEIEEGEDPVSAVRELGHTTFIELDAAAEALLTRPC